MLRRTGSRDVRQDAVGRAVLGRPVLLGSPVAMGSPVVMGDAKGSGTLKAAQAAVGRLTDPPETGRPGRAKPGIATQPGKTVAPPEDAGRDLGHSGTEIGAGKAVAARESVHLLRGAAAMAAPMTRALGRLPAAGLGPGRGESLAPGGTLPLGATIRTHAGNPAGSG
jgi:hypothetical protein